MLVPVYQFHQSIQAAGWPSVCYYYSTNQAPPSSNWTLDGVAFYGCRSTDQGAVAINEYSYTNRGSTRYVYGANPPSSDWTFVAVAFYAYSNNAQGGFSVYACCDLVTTGSWWYFGCFPTSYLPAASGYKQPQNAAFYAPMAGNATISYAAQNLAYANQQFPSGNPLLVGSQTVTNTSTSSTLTSQIAVTSSESQTFSWGLSETLTAGAEVTLTAGIPAITSAESKLSISLELNSTQQWSTTQEQSITVSGSIEVPPQGAVVCNGYVNLASNVTVPFSLQINATGSAPGGGSLTAAQLSALFNAQNPNFTGSQEPVPGSSPAALQLTMDGAFTGTLVVGTSWTVSDVNAVAGAAAAAVPAVTNAFVFVGFTPAEGDAAKLAAASAGSAGD